MRYLISYDLKTPGQDYQSLHDALNNLDATRVLRSQWVTRRSGTTAANIRDHLSQYMNSNDRLLVVAIDGTGWAGKNLITKISTL